MTQRIIGTYLLAVVLSISNASVEARTPVESSPAVPASPTVLITPVVPVFSTASEVVIANIGDYGLAGNDEAQVAAQVLSWNPDFITTNGNNNEPSGQAGTLDANVGRYYHSYLYPYKGSYGQGSPEGINRFFPILGNHDWNSSLNPKNQPYLDYFFLPGNERYYEFVWGPVHCFMLDSDPNEPSGRTASSIQAAWLKDRLSAAKEYWKLVFVHNAPYSSGDHPGSEMLLRWPYAAWGASAVFAGHERLYERLQVGGIPYFVNGAGGSELDGFAEKHLPESLFRYNVRHGAIRITANAVSLTADFIDCKGTRYDTCSFVCPWTPTPTPTPTFAPQILSGDGKRPLFTPNPVSADRSMTVFFPVATQKSEIVFKDQQGRRAGEYRFGPVAKADIELKGRFAPGLYTAVFRVMGMDGLVKSYQRKLLVTSR
jgi:hypothetical protein